MQQAPFQFEKAPVTFAAFFNEQLRDWDALFPAEQAYFTRLHAFTESAPPAFFEPLREMEIRMGVTRENWPAGRFTLEQVDFLNRNPLYPEWRKRVAALFAVIDPQLERELTAKGQPRLIIVISPADLPVGPDRLWLRIAARGKRIPIEPFATAPFAATLAAAVSRERGRYSSWLIEASGTAAPVAAKAGVRLNYDALAAYRRRLMREVRAITENPRVNGPRQLGERLKTLRLEAGESEFAADKPMSEFTRATLLNGNGTLLVNNTFVEWAGVQALRRARPHLLCCSFGIRNKVKPFSSLLIYEDQDQATQIPTQGDMLGSYVDLEVFYQYLWQEAGKYAEYRLNTVYLFLAEGTGEMLVIAPPDFVLPSGKVSGEALQAAAREWMRISTSETP